MSDPSAPIPMAAAVEEDNAHRRASARGLNVTHIHNHNNHYLGPCTVACTHVQTAINSNLGVNNGLIQQAALAPSASPPQKAQESSNAVPCLTAPSPLPGVVITHCCGILALLNPIHDASYTRNRKLSPPNSRCLPGTRKDVIKMVKSWINSSLLFSNPHIMWIYGYAGCGKSAIAQVIAEWVADKGRLAGSFFFFRGAGERSTSARFAGTMASQVAAAIPATSPIIKSAIEANPGLVSTSTTTLSAQFLHLVYEPVNEVKWDRLATSIRNGPFLIVVDGLDECSDHDDIATFISHMIEFFDKHPRIPLRFLITSRVENHLYQRLHSSKQVKLLNLVKHTSNADIETALDAAIDEEKCKLTFACEALWPCREDRHKLVQHIGGSYIFMTTLIRMLFNPENNDGLTPMERLPLLLEVRPDFDTLYKQTLAKSQALPHFQDIISAIALAESPPSISQIARELQIKTFHVSVVLVNLHSVIQVPGDDHTPVTLWHTSLRDFLCSEGRSGCYFANPVHHLRMAFRISHLTSGEPLNVIQSLREEHLQRCGEITDGAFDTCNGELGISLDEPLFGGQTALEIACRSKSWNIVRVLVNANADVNIRFCNDEDNISVALHAVCHFNEMDMVYFLLEKGADPNAASDPGCWYGSWGRYAFSLAWASADGRVDLVKHLLACGADPNLKGGLHGSALSAAAYAGKDEAVNILLAGGADLHATDKDGWTPLHWACLNGHVEVIMTLLMFGSDLSIQNMDGRTPLHLACFNGHFPAAEYLLDHGADPNIQDHDGDTPLHRACYQESVAVAELLLDRKGDPNIQNKKGKTALQEAEGENNIDVIMMVLLREAVT